MTIGTSTPPNGNPAADAASTAQGGNALGPGRHTGRKSRRLSRRPARLSLSNWPVSTRLAAVFIAASVTGLVFGGLRVADAVGTADSYARTTQLAVLGQQITQFAQDLENERDRTVGVVAVTTLQQDATADNAGPAVTASLGQAVTAAQGQLAGAQSATGTDVVAVQRLTQAVLSNTAFPVSVRDSANSVIAQVNDGGLGNTRLAAPNQSPAGIIGDYANTLSALYALDAQVAGSSGDAVLANEVSALSALSQEKDQAARQRAILEAAFIESGLNDAGGQKASKGHPAVAPFNNVGAPAAVNYASGLQALVTAQDLQLTDLATYQARGDRDRAGVVSRRPGAAQVGAAGSIYTAVTSANGNLPAIFPQLNQIIQGFTPATAPALWYADQSAVVNGMQATASHIATEIVGRSQLLQHQAAESGLITAIATVVVILLVLAATALIGRSLVNPLRQLQADALEIATVRLPARVAAAAARRGGHRRPARDRADRRLSPPTRSAA